MSEKMSEFYRALQVNLQNNMHLALEEVDIQAIEAQASIGDVSFCFGSSFASILFEMIRGSEKAMTTEQQQLAISMMKPFVDGFSEKLELLVTPNPEKMEVIQQ
jgi:hypothetical protein